MAIGVMPAQAVRLQPPVIARALSPASVAWRTGLRPVLRREEATATATATVNTLGMLGGGPRVALRACNLDLVPVRAKGRLCSQLGAVGPVGGTEVGEVEVEEVMVVAAAAAAVRNSGS